MTGENINTDTGIGIETRGLGHCSEAFLMVYCSIMKEMTITEVSELGSVVKEVMRVIKERKDSGAATVLALHGDLGAGKTTFTQTLARTLGVEETVTSPTFVIMKGYELHDQPFEKLIHIDAYRIEDIDEMRPLGFSTLLEEKSTIMCIEWAEHIAALLPADVINITFKTKEENRRVIID